MKVIINAATIGHLAGDIDVMLQLDRNITDTSQDMDSADEAEKSFLLGKLTGLLMVHDGLDALAAYEQALTTWSAIRKATP